ncbi:MAG: hypothetical protein PHC64_10290, partial [Candidatus Gastranaerophilales bacterium]|nr:hypothetical protein [Candidatus Gastranaerophilales bacterium]
QTTEIMQVGNAKSKILQNPFKLSFICLSCYGNVENKFKIKISLLISSTFTLPPKQFQQNKIMQVGNAKSGILLNAF